MNELERKAPPETAIHETKPPVEPSPADRRKRNPILLVLSVLMSVGGIAGFIYLFARDFNVYWLILAPIIIALYQVPAVFFFWLYKRSGPRSAQPVGEVAPEDAPSEKPDGCDR